MNCEMKNAKKLLSILILGTVICTHTYNVYQTSYAAEAVVAGGLASAGVALLGLGAIAGVGMELDNNRRFNELSDEEKQRIENGLATNFEDVALQRGASVEKIKNWTTDLCTGVLDKSSECWGIFKDWIKNVTLENKPIIPEGGITMGSVLPITFIDNYNSTHVINRITSDDLPDNLKDEKFNTIVYTYNDNSYTNSFTIQGFRYSNTEKTKYEMRGARYTFNRITGTASLSYTLSDNNGTVPIQIGKYNSSLPNNSNTHYIGTIPISVDGSSDYVYDSPSFSETLFSTNTDYLERLKGQDEDVIDVIDVTDIKNPIIETRPNSLANINWNRGTRRTNNNKDDDDNKMVTGLVPMDVWYEQIDDEQEQMQNAVVVYNNYIQEHPEEKDTYFISTTPITNINNYFNTLPVVNIPATGTVVNNNYEYNNYNNNNVTIYQEPYNAGIIPTFPDFKNKFPFCIPFDLYEFFVVFLAEKEAPKIEVPFPIIDNTNHALTVEHITIDLSGYEYLSDVLRVMLFVLFCVGLMILTRQLIKG